MKRQLILILLLALFSCADSGNSAQIEKWKKEITDTEKSFAQMAKTDGIRKAFMYYAADDAVLMRNNIIIKGSEGIDSIYNSVIYEKAQLNWQPDYVDVSSSGDLGYTYGRYFFSLEDSSGEVKSSEGIFHTVWKRQPDNSWKFVWD